ncbi:hypothetical protein [Microbacter margulisiae]|uniref:Right handed beta helix region n=1 Tax=Microbacter margulisiae TaxID=1350067 RepID=A0A7W5H0U2_9PORP|nr:hypothetical protein [Microbacter margulisiae]MBB3186903.1 hypothetical protein [Microbacter margulisiae]
MRSIVTLFIVLFALLLTNCTESKIAFGSDGKLAFSCDTLSFDTVFSTIGSTTQDFMVYNRSGNPVTIKSIQLVNGTASGFHINVDGTNLTDNELQNIEIKAHDSIYVFVSVTVNPQQQNNPVLIEDSVLFETNTNRQIVKLLAYGQDVTIFRSKTIHNDTTLTNAKPYLIYNYLAIDSGKTLTIQPGAKFYFHQNASLQVNGNLIADGGLGANQQITMQGDRIDWLFPGVPYAYLSGQWGGVQLSGAQSTYLLNHVILIDGKIGVNIPNGNNQHQPIVNIENSSIQNFDSCGIAAKNANLNMYNCEISNCKSYCLYFAGGTYTLTHNTIANYYNDVYGGKQRDGNPSVVLMDKDKDAIWPLSVIFNNCVITGYLTNELFLPDTLSSSQFKFHFNHCYIMSPAISSSNMSGMIWGNSQDNIFVNSTMQNGYYNFEPDSLSVLRGKADPAISRTTPYQYDMNGIYRFWNNQPDIGAYEWIPKNGIPKS